MEPDRKLCIICGVELPFYLGPDDLCPRCKGEVRDGIITPGFGLSNLSGGRWNHEYLYRM